MPSGRVGNSKDAIFRSNEHFREAVAEREAQVSGCWNLAQRHGCMQDVWSAPCNIAPVVDSRRPCVFSVAPPSCAHGLTERARGLSTPNSSTQDVGELESRLGRKLEKAERARIGVGQLRRFLEHLLQRRYLEVRQLGRLSGCGGKVWVQPCCTPPQRRCLEVQRRVVGGAAVLPVQATGAQAPTSTPQVVISSPLS